MRLYIKLVFSILLLVLGNLQFYAQENKIMEAKVKSELQKRGLSENEVREALQKNNINPDQLEKATPDQIVQIQKIIEDLEVQKKEEVKKEIKPQAIEEVKTEIKNEIKEDVKSKIDESRIQAEEVKRLSKIYGHELFNLAPKEKTDLLKVNDNYVLGPGDKISVSVWSNRSQLENSYIIEKDGYIKFDKTDLKKRVFLTGLTFSIARSKIEQVLSRYMIFNKGEINIALQSSRNIKVSVYGEVLKPGSFSMDATNSVFEGVRYSSGVTDIASVRNIKLIRAKGDFKVFDLYKYLSNPTMSENFFLDNDDVIHVPVAEKIVTIEGGIKRPYTFELIQKEGIKDLLNYAGGYSEDAIKNKFQIERFVENKKIFIDIELYDTNGKINDFELFNGDIVHVRTITVPADNYFYVNGAVYNPGRFENNGQIRVSDALKSAGLMPESKLDFAFLIRKNDDGTGKYIKLDLDTIIKNKGNDYIDLKLENEDRITIWSKSRFADKAYIEVVGAVRDTTKTYLYGSVQSIKISEAIILAGGLSRNASDIAFVHRQDPLKDFEKQYIRVNLRNIYENPQSSENFNLQPYDKLEVLTQNLFNESTMVSISGAVNKPGEYQYGKKMSLLDLVTMAGGFKLAASTSNIEVSRIVIQNNNPTKTIVAKINMDKIIVTGNDNYESFVLEPYDNVYVRYIPEFEMQKVVNIIGEIQYPGFYTLTSKNEKVSDIINRAGGLTEEAFEDGATLYRKQDSIGYIVMRLGEALKNSKSKFNYILKNEDILEIPKQKDFVTIQGATKVYEVYKEEIAFNKFGINVPYHSGKRAMYYIDNYAGGLNEQASKKDILVENANGEVKKTTDFGLFKIYPKVKKGSLIKVAYKKEKTKEEKEDKGIDWNKIINDSVAQISTIMTLVILFKTLSQ
jgi:protein involved in polysaccharide export with SLBB domain